MANKFEEAEFTKVDIKAWKQIFAYMKDMKKEIGLLFLSVFILAILDTVLPQLNRIVIDNYIMMGDASRLSEITGIYILFISVFGFVVWAFILLASQVQLKVSYKIRRDAFKRLQELSFSYYDNSSVGWLMSRLTSDTNRIGSLLSWGFVDIGWAIMVMFFVTIIMLVMNWKLALLTLAVVPIIFVVSYFFQTRLLKEHRRVRKLNSKITGAFNEGITGSVTTKTLVMEQENVAEFSGLTEDMRGASVRAAKIDAVYFPIVMTLGSFGAALIIYYGGLEVFQNRITFGELILFVSYSRLFYDPLLILARMLTRVQEAQASAERVISLINQESDIVDAPEVIEKYGTIENRKIENWESIKGDIQLIDVGFKYKNGEKVMEKLNLTVKAGSSIAIVGPTGSGKSTLVNLICRFYEPTSGQILIDGVDYRQRSQDWLHSNLGYVLQTPQLFSGTLKENIRYGKLDATDEEIIATAKLINAHDFILKFPEGYDTVIGENGSGLSTGQKQLISFARALIGNPAILILDEATASIDVETEHLLQNAIQTLLKDRTSFIIAHRLSTIVNADQILYVKDGEIIEQGTHAQLIEKHGAYYELYMGQFEKIA